MQIIKAIRREEVLKAMFKEDLQNTLLIDTYNGASFNMEKFRTFNPFYTWEKPVIPVPGTNKHSKSIEGIWQGCKLVHNKFDYDQFNSLPFKRPSEKDRDLDISYSYKDSIFSYEEEIINLIEARYLIYLISYLYLLNELISEELLYNIASVINHGKHVLFFDWDSNFDINDSSSSFSHSAILAAWFNKSLDKFVDNAKNFLNKEFYNLFARKFINLTTRYKKYAGGHYDF
ncbi:MAG: hypothetical protein A3E87_05470 [Gammaproteobacteria bacterium RIFCSPHIGHO2_12_FULL_35_23]|nr:MAG: hypothetical protein A3E87_05470 [Gammaproteobacteria bacterium RIFCSPHIGHO2_12_FULL_35_23]